MKVHFAASEPSLATMLALVSVPGVVSPIGEVAEVAFAGITTDAGNVTAGSVEVRVTVVPLGLGAVRETVTEYFPPPRLRLRTG